MNNLGMAQENAGRYVEAEKPYTETLRHREQVSGDTDPNTINAMQNLAMVSYDQGKYEAAESWLAKAIATRSRLWGEQDPLTMWYRNNLAVVYEREGKTRPAENCSGMSSRDDAGCSATNMRIRYGRKPYWDACNSGNAIIRRRSGNCVRLTLRIESRAPKHGNDIIAKLYSVGLLPGWNEMTTGVAIWQ